MCNELKKSDLPWFTRINWHENMPIKIYVIISVPSKVRNCANAQYHQTICAVKSHSCALAISKFKSKMIFNIIFGQNASVLIAFILFLTILPCADAHEYTVHFRYITILCLCFTNTPHSWMQLTLFLSLQKIAYFTVSPLKTGFTIYSNYRSWRNWVNNNNWANIYPN